MSDPRVMAQLRIINGKLDELAASRDASFREIHDELEIVEQTDARQDAHLKAHDRELARHDRLIRWLCRKVGRRAR